MITKTSPLNIYQVSMFCVDDLIPQDHILRKINSAFSWDFIYDLTEELYSSTLGRPSIDSVIIFKILFLEYLDNNGSIRKTLERCQTDLAYRYFLGLTVYDPIPSYSSFSKLYERKFKNTGIFEEIFKQVLAEAEKRGLIDTENIFVDSTHAKASANAHKSVGAYKKEVSTGLEEELKEAINTDRLEHNKKELKEKKEVPIYSYDLLICLSNEESIVSSLRTKEDIESYLFNLEERKRSDLVLKEATKWFIVSKNLKKRQKFLYYEPYIVINGKLKRLVECENIDLSGFSKKKVSKIDCQSGWFHKGEHKSVFAYTIQTACDKNGYILSYSIHPGNMHDSKSFFELFRKLKDKPISTIIMDSGYKTPAICRELILNSITPLLPYKRPMTKLGFFKKYEYAYDEYYDCYICPNNKILKYKTTNREGYREYYSDPNECLNCPIRFKCTQSSNYTKVVTRHIWSDFLEKADDFRYKIGNNDLYKCRKQTIERCFGTSKELHGLRYTHFRGIDRIESLVAMTFCVINLKKIAMHS